MSGIVGSSHNIRGSGIVAKLGTDGQVFTSAGLGIKQTYEAAGGGAWNLIKTLTSDGSDATLNFVNGTSDVVLDSTYDVYCFQYTNIHPETDSANLQFNCSTDTGSAYDADKVTTFYKTTHNEADNSYALGYDNGTDMIGTGYCNLNENTGNGNDESCSGHLFIYGPSSTTFQKFFYNVTATHQPTDQLQQSYVAGYCTSASAVDAVSFKMASGEIQGGKIKMYGIS